MSGLPVARMSARRRMVEVRHRIEDALNFLFGLGSLEHQEKGEAEAPIVGEPEDRLARAKLPILRIEDLQPLPMSFDLDDLPDGSPVAHVAGRLIAGFAGVR
jgi:hypothetical protein